VFSFKAQPLYPKKKAGHLNEKTFVPLDVLQKKQLFSLCPNRPTHGLVTAPTTLSLPRLNTAHNAHLKYIPETNFGMHSHKTTGDVKEIFWSQLLVLQNKYEICFVLGAC
jgi:hypothetical protein